MEKKFFRVIAECSTSIVIKSESFHFSYERKVRRELIFNKLGQGIEVASFVVDKGHINGFERHIIYNNGVILVVNESTKKVVTIMVARVGNIVRYWKDMGRRIPRNLEYLISVARVNEMKGYNYL